MADDNQPLLLQLSADIRGLEKAFDRAQGVVRTRSKQMQDDATSLEKFFGKPSLAKALDKTFDATRFKILDSGAARVGLLGSALESLGPAGLAAAAAIGALGLALEGAHKALEFADGLYKLALNAHVSTDELQAFQFALRIAGGNGEEAAAGLQAFSTKLGLAQEGMPKAQRAFLALGFSKAQIKGFGDAGDALVAVTERIEKLKSPAQKDAVIQQLGLEQMKPLIEGGVERMRDFLAEAQRAGVVMDAGLVQRGHEMNEQLETLNQKIGVQLKSALIDVGPLLLEIVSKVADIAKFAADAAHWFHQFAIDPVTAQQIHMLSEMAKGFREGGGLGAVKASIAAGVDAQAHAAGLREVTARNRAAREATGATDTPGGPQEDDPDFIRRHRPPKLPSGGASLIDQSKGKAAPRDDTVQRTEQVNAALSAADRQVLQALLALATTTEGRAVLQKQIAAKEDEIEQARLSKEQADIAGDKGLSAPKKAALIAELEIAKLQSTKAAHLKQQEIDNQTADQLARERLGQDQVARDGEAALLQLQGQLTFSEQARAKIALRLVDIAYEREKAELEGLIAAHNVSAADKAIAAAKLKQLQAEHPLRQEDARRGGSAPAQHANGVVAGVKQQASRAETFRAELAEIDRLRQADLGHEREYAQAKAQIEAEYHAERLNQASSFFGNLATLSGSSNKTLAAIGKAAAITQATIDGIVAVQKALASAPPPFNFAIAAAVGVAAAVNVAKIAGFEEGGYTGDGGRKRVAGLVHGEEYVINAAATARSRPLLDAINAGFDIRGLLPAPSIVTALPAQTPAPVRGGDVHLHNNQNFAIAHEDLGRQIERNPRVLKQVIVNMLRNGELKLG